jgi:hypothetical protein
VVVADDAVVPIGTIGLVLNAAARFGDSADAEFALARAMLETTIDFGEDGIPLERLGEITKRIARKTRPQACLAWYAALADQGDWPAESRDAGSGWHQRTQALTRLHQLISERVTTTVLLAKVAIDLLLPA